MKLTILSLKHKPCRQRLGCLRSMPCADPGPKATMQKQDASNKGGNPWATCRAELALSEAINAHECTRKGTLLHSHRCICLPKTNPSTTYVRYCGHRRQTRRTGLGVPVAAAQPQSSLPPCPESHQMHPAATHFIQWYSVNIFSEYCKEDKVRNRFEGQHVLSPWFWKWRWQIPKRCQPQTWSAPSQKPEEYWKIRPARICYVC